ncbi:Trypsin CFT-1 [Papilio xuthus]|uniref:Trypsin CFT-1 n=1 Tax=Papilio xuthus TaxID=66420 RepID=A0A194PP38_PAPXU|nr:Trypsin CFT-1 [Papilio xuthus]
MRISLLILALGLAVVAAGHRNPQRIVGGSETTISEYPFSVSLLYSFDSTAFIQLCGGSILNNRSILSAGHCFYYLDLEYRWRSRVGSTYANSGGVVHSTSRIIIHPEHREGRHDIAILQVTSAFAFNDNVRPASIAGVNYNLRDNEVVWAIGWGNIYHGGPASEVLRHVQIWTINQNKCRELYAHVDVYIEDYMLCSGWLDVGGRDQCSGDSGSPLLHNNVVVGVCSGGLECANPRYPGINTRVSYYSTWIQSNA